MTLYYVISLWKNKVRLNLLNNYVITDKNNSDLRKSYKYEQKKKLKFFRFL